MENGRGVQRILRAFRCSLVGLGQALSKEAAFRQELVLVLLLIPIALKYGEGRMEQALLLSSLLLILIVEILNSAIESTVDRIGKERHPLAGRAKDLGSAAVLLALVHAALVWGLLLWP